MTAVSGEINLQSKHDLICHVLKMKTAMSVHSMADVIPFFSTFDFLFKSNTSITTKRKQAYFAHSKENSIHNVFCVLMFQQLLANKHHRLRDSRFGQVWVCSPTKLKKTRSFRCYNSTFKILLFSYHCSRIAAHSKVVLDDSLITVDTTSLDQYKLYYCTNSRRHGEISDDVKMI